MRAFSCTIMFAVFMCGSAAAQQSSFQDSLLDCFTGSWVLKGTIAGQSTTHDLAADWVLAHNYVQLHEVSHEKNSDGSPVYEAIVYIGWDSQNKEYQCLWLDVTSGNGLSGQVIGHGKRSGDSIVMLFKSPDGSLFHTTFAYERSSGTWQWIMDGEENGKLQPFARLKMTKS